LPGNSSGFVTTSVDLTELDPVSFPTLYVGITLQTTDTSVTPTVDNLALFYDEVRTTLANANFSIRGNKSIGTTATSAPIYKYTDTNQTDASGELLLPELEFDEYVFAFPGYDIATACDDHPTTHRAGEDTDIELWLVGDDTNTLRVKVEDMSGNALPGAEIEITRPSSPFNRLEVTNNCGQSFFTGGIGAETDYELEVRAPGFITETISPFEINEDGFVRVVLTE
jgi:hypothetical protein